LAANSREFDEFSTDVSIELMSLILLKLLQFKFIAGDCSASKNLTGESSPYLNKEWIFHWLLSIQLSSVAI
jgi:hypothetical protein